MKKQTNPAPETPSFSVNRIDFVKGLETILPAINTTSRLPILSNARLAWGNKGVTLTATNLVVTIQCVIPAETKSSGVVICPARVIYAVVKTMSAERLNMSVKKDVLSMLGGGRYNFFCMSPDDFPSDIPIESQHAFKMEQGVVKRMLKETTPCVSSDNSRQVLCGFYFSIGARETIIVTTDGTQLACANVPTADTADATIIIPTEAAIILTGLLGNDGPVKIIVENARVVFQFSGCQFISKLIEGKYPNYEQVIPKKGSSTATINREELITTLSRMVCLLIRNDHLSVKMSFDKEQLSLALQSQSSGDALESIPIKYTGDPVVLAVDPQRLLSMLPNFSDEKITIRINGESTPIVIQNESLLYILMPLRST